MGLLLAACVLVCPVLAYGQIDIPIGPARGTFFAPPNLQNVTWAGNGMGAINNNFIFSYPVTDAGMCVYILNNDSFVHTISLAVRQTADPTQIAYQGVSQKWIAIGPSGPNTSITISAGNLGAYYYRTTSAARIALVFSGGSGTGTASVWMAFTTAGGCGPVGFPLNTALSQFESQSYGASTGYAANQCTTNPGANADLFNLIAHNAGSIHSATYFRFLRISTTAAAQINVDRITNQGNICTAVPSTIQSNLSLATALGTLVTTCSTPPAIGGVFSSQEYAANAPTVVDLTGLWSPLNSGTSVGIMVTNPSAITGTVCVDAVWSEAP